MYNTYTHTAQVVKANHNTDTHQYHLKALTTANNKKKPNHLIFLFHFPFNLARIFCFILSRQILTSCSITLSHSLYLNSFVYESCRCVRFLQSNIIVTIALRLTANESQKKRQLKWSEVISSLYLARLRFRRKAKH